MEYIALWQLAADAGLVLGIIFLATRLVQSGVNGGMQARIRNLEMQLRASVREAQAMAEEFEKTLDGKQKALEEVLFEVQATESRTRRTLVQAKERDQDKIQDKAQTRPEPRPSEEVREAEQVLHKVPESVPAHPSTQPETFTEPLRAPEESPSSGVASAYMDRQQEIQAETPSADIPEPASFQAKPNNPFFAAMSRKTYGTGPKLNIFGEPIPGTDPDEVQAPVQQFTTASMGRAVARRQGLAAQVETFVDLPQGALPSASASFLPPHEMTTAQQVRPSLNDIYAAAESFLRSGQTLEMVAARTRLPAEEVRMLSQIIERERTSRQQSEEFQTDTSLASRVDERLGVLGGIRRNEQEKGE